MQEKLEKALNLICVPAISSLHIFSFKEFLQTAVKQQNRLLKIFFWFLFYYLPKHLARNTDCLSRLKLLGTIKIPTKLSNQRQTIRIFSNFPKF